MNINSAARLSALDTSILLEVGDFFRQGKKPHWHSIGKGSASFVDQHNSRGREQNSPPLLGVGQ